MSRTKMITVVCWIISAAALLGLAIWFIVGLGTGIGSAFRFESRSFDMVSQHFVPAEQMDSINIDWTAGAVSIHAFGGDEIQITEFSRQRVREDEQLSFDVNRGTLEIRFTERRILRNNLPSKQLEVLIPYALSESFESFHVNTVSGRVYVENINADDFLVNTVSGRIELVNISASMLNTATTSGRIELNTVQATDAHLRTVSGRITADNTEIQNINSNTTSGRHELNGSFENVSVRSASGRIEVRSEIVPENLTAQTASGRIEIAVPNEGPISVQHSTTAGRFTSHIPVITHSGADAQFNLSAGSGRIIIYELR